MDLEQYKKTWTRQPKETQKVSREDIYKMTQAKSSSIVKWIFIIGILEFILLNSSYFFFDFKEIMNQYKKLGLEKFIFYSQIILYAIVIYFLIQFYRNYKKISVTDTTNSLMGKIIKTRRTVRNYVILNLSYIVILLIAVSIAFINAIYGDISAKKLTLIIATFIAILIIFLGIFWLFYQLLYGILLRKLKNNYKELAKLEDSN